MTATWPSAQRTLWRVTPLLAIFALGLALRATFTPYTTGSDIPQFAGFADTFLRRGLCFYKYSASYQTEKWPYPWPYPYGPLLVLLLAPLRLVAGREIKCYWEGGIYHVYAPVEWVVLVKAVFVFFDTLAAVLVYLLIGRWSRRGALLALAFYYLNPVTIYVSSIYGMFDSIPLSLLLLSMFLIERGSRGRDHVDVFAAGFLLALATTTKMNVLYSALFVALWTISTRGFSAGRDVRALVLGSLAGLVLPYSAFEAGCAGSLLHYAMSVLSVSRPAYNPPIVYSFNGFTSLATYMNERTGGDYLWLISGWWIPSLLLVALLFARLVARGRRKPGLFETAYLSYLVYVTTYWRVNYQYFTPLIGLAALHIFLKERPLDAGRLLSLVHALLVATWVFLFPVSWWAQAHIETPNSELVNLLNSITAGITQQEPYLAYSLAVTALGYATLITHLRPRGPGRKDRESSVALATSP